MTNRLVAVFLGVSALVSASPALASTDGPPRAGHYEWQAGTAAGPRAPLAAPRRVWVSSAPEATQMASCDVPCATPRAS
jgi:hypothetical protein